VLITILNILIDISIFKVKITLVSNKI